MSRNSAEGPGPSAAAGGAPVSGRQRLAEAAEVASREAPDIELERQLVVGHTRSVLSVEGALADIVVIGVSSAGVGAPAGSVAVGNAVRAPCTVVVVRGPAVSAAASLPVVVGVDGAGGDAAIASGTSSAHRPTN